MGQNQLVPGENSFHPRPGSLALVLCGGVVGAAAREAVGEALPTAHNGFPFATLLVNLSGAFLLGLALEAMVRLEHRPMAGRRLRLLVATGFLGAFTTYSTFAVETDLLVRSGRAATAVAYLVATVGLGSAAAIGGIAAGASRARTQPPALPIDPDVEDPGDGAAPW